jgi:hypothetical protein
MISKSMLRSRFFDYSPPFEYVGLTYMRQKYRYPATIFNFMRPFEITIWFALLATVFLSAIFIYILEYWNPFMNKVDDGHKFNWSEVMWYSFGTVSGAGGSFAAIMYPTRVFSAFYWFFALILTASYTGNLASFLTESFEIEPDGSIEGLGFSNGVKWATLPDSYMDSFIRGGTTAEYRRLVSEMNYVENYTAGVKLVQDDENYVFIGNNLLLHYYEGKSHLKDCMGTSNYCSLSSEQSQYTTEIFDITKQTQ